MKETDFYLLRSPAFSYLNIVRMNSCSTKDELVQFLRDFYRLEYVQNAIFLASPQLYKQLMRWLSQGQDELSQRLFITLYKYLIRMCMRPTPFGLFSGVSLGVVTESPSSFLRNDSHTTIKKVAGEASKEISNHLSSIREVKLACTLESNVTLYAFDQGYRFYEYRLKKGRRQYFLSYVESSPYLDYVLSKARNGVIYSDLLMGLCEMDIPLSLAEDYIDQLVSEQLLVNRLESSITGQSIFRSITRILNPKEGGEQWFQWAKKWEEQIQDTSTVVASNYLLTSSIERVLNLKFEKSIIQADMKIGMDVNQINKTVIKQITQELGSLSSLFEVSVPAELDEFKKRFIERYDSEEIPLLEAIDSDTGIGYGDTNDAFSLLDFNYDQADDPLKNQRNTSREEVVPKIALDLYIEYLKNRQSEIVITDEHLRSYDDESKETSEVSFNVLGSLNAEGSAALDNGQFQFFVRACNGPSAVPLMARFCSVEPALEEKLSEMLAEEQDHDSNVIFASIAHVPDPAVTGIVQRPSLRQYEIPLLSAPGVEEEHRIHIDDLFVSIIDGQVVLHSKKLNKRIVPRLDSAHNYGSGMVLYRFLADLQYQDQNIYVNWDWGALANESFLPRVRYKHIVLSRARWVIKKEVLAYWGDLKGAEARASFIKEHQLPSQVMLVNGDNELLIDFQSLLGFELLCSELKKSDVLLLEPIFNEGQCIIRGGAGEPYTNELVIPIHKRQKNTARRTPNAVFEKSSIQRRFSLGSEWVYLKIYCGIQTADRILKQELPVLLNKLDQKAVIKQWFFIRYSDPDYHLRIRFKLKYPISDNLDYLLSTIHRHLNPLVEKRHINKLQFDTYCREIERYGVETMELSERLFYVDSEFVVQALTDHQTTEINRLLIAMYGINQLLDCFGLCEHKKIAFVEFMSNYFLAEQGNGWNIKYEFDKKFRAHRNDIDTFFKSESGASGLIPLFQKRKENLLDISNELRSILPDDFKQVDALLQSYSHMFQNRLYLTEPRMNEALAYHCLLKYYRSILRRRKMVFA